MKLILLSAAIWLSIHAIAADAVFSADGKSVYMASYKDQSVLVANDEAPLPKAASLPIEFPGARKGACVYGVSRMKDGDICLSCDNALWLWTPGTTKASLIQRMAGDEEIDSFACNPLTDEIILTSGGSLFWK